MLKSMSSSLRHRISAKPRARSDRDDSDRYDERQIRLEQGWSKALPSRAEMSPVSRVLASDLSGKRLELLKETVPETHPCGVLCGVRDASESVSDSKRRKTPQKLWQLQLQSMEVRHSRRY